VRGIGNSRFLHCGGKCAAFGRNDDSLVTGREEQTTTTAKAAADFSTAAAKCAAFGRNDDSWGWGRKHAKREIIWNDE
jgi:hypothetical protein